MAVDQAQLKLPALACKNNVVGRNGFLARQESVARGAVISTAPCLVAFSIPTCTKRDTHKRFWSKNVSSSIFFEGVYMLAIRDAQR